MPDELEVDVGVPRVLPPSVVPGRRTPTFTASNVPAALLSAHLTNAWAELIVVTGSVRFFDEDPPWEVTAVPGRPVVIIPKRLHHIEPMDGAEFAVQFYDQPDRNVGGESGDGQDDETKAGSETAEADR